MEKRQTIQSIMSDSEEHDHQEQQVHESAHEHQKSKRTNKKKCTINSNLVVNLAQTKYVVVKRVVKNMLGMKTIKDSTSKDWDLYWTDNAVQPEQLARMKPYQKINHFPGMFTLSRKNNLARNLSKMAKEYPKEYNFYPKTWVLPSELNQLRQQMDNDSSMVVIAKPEASCQGKGIFLTKNIQDFQFGGHYVVQKYLKKPLLIDKLKFDLRIYVLIAGCDPLRIYIFKEGLARFSTDEYQTPKKENLGNLFMHLTNYAINKNSNKFEFNLSKHELDRGHKRSLTAILSHLKAQGFKADKIWEQIQEIIVKTIISVQPILSHHYRSCQPQNHSNNMCFQLLGFDVILDNKLKPWILEVNYTPSFNTDTPLDKIIKESLIKQCLVLMNFTSKSKNEILSLKKKQMLERTLTGKRSWLSKEDRQIAVKKAQFKRNLYEDRHLGDFERIFPVSEANAVLTAKYLKFLEYSQKCYLEYTGANIIRSAKITPAPLKEVLEDAEMLKENQKFTNSEALQRIYKAKFKPMIAKRKQQEPSTKNTYIENPTSLQSIPNKEQKQSGPLRKMEQFKTTCNFPNSKSMIKRKTDSKPSDLSCNTRRPDSAASKTSACNIKYQDPKDFNTRKKRDRNAQNGKDPNLFTHK